MGGKESKNPQLVGMTYLWQVEMYCSLLEPKFSAPFKVFEDYYRMGLHKNRNLEIKLHQQKESDVLKKFRCVSALLDHRGIQYYSQTKEVGIGKGINDVVLLKVPGILLEDELLEAALMSKCYMSLKISSIGDNSESSALDTNSACETLSSDLRKLYSDQTGSDVIICTGPDDYFMAHRLILSARSPVFEAMFRHNTAERVGGVVNVTDIEVPVLANLLLYMYTGKVHGLDSNSATPVIEAADKYDLQDLKDTCLEMLLNNLTIDNIYDAILLAEMCDIVPLKKEIQAFMSKNAAEVIKSDKWEELQDHHPDVVNSILATLLMSAEAEKK